MRINFQIKYWIIQKSSPCKITLNGHKFIYLAQGKR